MKHTEVDEDAFTREMKLVVAETIKELHATDTGIRFKKPNTIHGWLAVTLACIALSGFVGSSIIFLNNVSTHHQLPAHSGTKKLLEEVAEIHELHSKDQVFHIKEERLQLQILAETAPIHEKVSVIKEDVKAIETKVDILLDREFKRNAN